MKLSSWNVNGLRACIKKGFWDWYHKNNADVTCLQEAKITEADFEKIVHEFGLVPLCNPEQQALVVAESNKKPIYYALATAKKAGYSGVLLLSKTKPKEVRIGVGDPRFDDEGRTIIADYGDFVFVGAYFPNSGPELARIPYKIDYSDCLLALLQDLRKTRKHIILCGDMNVAHTEQDIKNAKSNVNNAGFTPLERDWFTKFLSHKFTDTFRYLNPTAKDMYTWWSYRPGVREKNIGWRIDYFVVTDETKKMIVSAEIEMNQHGSDHCPVHLEIAV